MNEIRDVMWLDGQGPLATKFGLVFNEIRSLIKALYSPSAAREQLLQKLH